MTTLTQWPFDNDPFGGIFSSTFAKSILPELDRIYDVKSTYPYDIIKKCDKDGNLQSYRLSFALSGFSKDDIDVKIIGDELKIVVNKRKDEIPEDDYIHHGIVHRDMQVTFKIGSMVDKKNIAMKLQDGLLSIDVPISKENTYNVKFIED